MTTQASAVVGQANISGRGKHWFDRAIWFLAGFYFLFFAYFSYFLYQNLLYKDFDLAVHAQTLWNLAHGSGFSSVLGVHFLANHFIPVFYPLAAVYRFFPDPFLLLALQSLALAAGVILVYRMARRILDGPWSFLAAMVYFFYPPVGYSNLYEFHPTTLAVPFVLSAILAYLEEKFWPFIGWACIAMMFQENIPFGILLMGGVALVERRKMIWIVAPAALAAGWLYLSLGCIQPALNRGTIDFFGFNYSYLGNSPREALFTLLLKPWRTLAVLGSFSTVLYLIQIFGPLLFLPFVSWHFLLPVAPFLAQHLLSARLMEREITRHYSVDMVPYLVTAAVFGMVWFRERFKDVLLQRLLLFGFLSSFFLTAVLGSPYFRLLDESEAFSKSGELKFKQSLLARVPPAAPVVATFQFLPKLSGRRELYSFHHVWKGTYTLSKKAYLLPASTQYALLDMNDDFNFTGNRSEKSPELLERFRDGSDWEVVDFGLDTVLLKKGRRDLSALYRVERGGTAPALPPIRLKAYAGNAVKLSGCSLKMGQGDHEGHVGISFYWQALKKPKNRYEMLITLVDPRRRTVYSYRHNICYRFYPTGQWKPGERITENFWFILPPRLLREPLEMRVGLLNIDEKRFEPFRGPLKSQFDEYGRVRIDTFDPV